MRGHAHKRTGQREKPEPRPFGMPKEEPLVVCNMRKYRQMVIRGEYSELLNSIREEPNDIKYVISLLGSKGVGVAPNAADALLVFVSYGVDIEEAVPALQKALENQYARENAAATISAYESAKGQAPANDYQSQALQER